MLEEIKSSISNANEKVGNLEKQLNQSNAVEDEELTFLQTENNKLKYRIKILERSISEESSKRSSSLRTVSKNKEMECIISALERIFLTSISKSYPTIGETNPAIKLSTFADYQCNAAMPLAKKIKDLNLGKSDPKSIATQLLENIPPNDIIGSLNLSNRGFINIHINPNYICEKVRDIIIHGVNIKHQVKQKIIVDYSSPNIAKEMHVGHLRSTIIGDCIANVLEFLGHKVVRVNHIGDWGTQFGMLLAHLTEKYPNYLHSMPQITDLQNFYKQAKERFDTEESFKKKAHQCVVQLQSKQSNMYHAWKQICDISRNEFTEIYKLLDINNLEEKGESFYQDMMKSVVDDLKAKGLTELDEGRLIMFPLNKPVPLTLVKSDGGFTYDTSDMACIKYRIEVEKADRIIYVTDAGQETHFSSIFSCAEAAGYYDPRKVKVEHVGFGVVLGENKKKFKTRSGDTVRLKDLLFEGIERSRAKLIEKERHKVLTTQELEIAEMAIAFGCIKYADLSQDRVKVYEFSFDRMLDDKGNTAVYLLYSLARIKSIIRKAQLDKPIETIAQSMNTLNLTHIREIRLAKFILKFPEMLFQVANDLYPHTICSYLFELSVIFSEFYEQCYCIEKIPSKTDGNIKVKVNYDRILLCEAASRILSTGLKLLGIKIVEKM